MKKLALSAWIVLAAILAINFPLNGQEIQKDKPECTNSYWISGGIGRSYFGPTFNGSISYSYNGNIFTARYLKADEFTWGDPGGGNVSEDPPLSMKEFGILYGRSDRTRNLVLSLSAGISYIDAVNRGRNIAEKEYEKVNIKTIGFPFEAHIRIEFTDFLGIGGSCFGDLNSKKSFVGGAFNLYIGKF